MKITFKKIRYKNILSTGQSFTEIELNTHPTTLFVGANGMGKSTLLDVLSFVLFNKPFRNINKPQLVNSINKKEAVAEIEFDVNGNSYKVVRGIKPNTFEIYENESLITQSAEQKDYQEFLEKDILKINHKSFCQVVVLGSASYTPFMSLSAAHRREVIENLLDLSIFSAMNSVLKNDINDTTKTIELLDIEIDSIKKALSVSQQQQLTQFKMSQINTDSKTTLKNEIEKNIIDLQKELEKISAKIVQLADQQNVISQLQSRLKNYADMRTQMMLSKQTALNFIDTLSKHLCSECGQNIHEDFRQKQTEKKQIHIVEVDSALQKVAKKIDEINQELRQAQERDSQTLTLRVEHQTISAQIKNQEKFLESIRQELEDINKQTGIDSDLIKQINDTVNNLTQQQTEKIEQLAQLKTTNKIQQQAAVLLKDGGIKTKIITKYINIINKTINEFLAHLGLFVNFELDEEFQETIKSRYRDTFTFNSFSEGEKMRINLAILFTWRHIAKMRNAINTNLLIMDEIFESSLDSVGVEEFSKILKTTLGAENTIIISHKTDQLYDKFDRVMKFTKQKNFSVVTQV